MSDGVKHVMSSLHRSSFLLHTLTHRRARDGGISLVEGARGRMQGATSRHALQRELQKYEAGVSIEVRAAAPKAE
jgi:hypothetical protein